VPATAVPATYHPRTYDAGPIAQAVAACPSVRRLSGGPHDRIVTRAPGRAPVIGVRLLPDEITVQVVGRFGPSVAEIAAEVRGSVAAAVPAAAGIPVHVVIDDLDAAVDDALDVTESDRAAGDVTAGPDRDASREAAAGGVAAARQAVRAADAAVRAADAAVQTASAVLRTSTGPG
jgi:hypothetical protein